MKKYWKIGVFILTDILLINSAFIIALMLRFDFNMYSADYIKYLSIFSHWFLLITGIKIALNTILGLYSSLWKYASIDELLRVCVTASFGLLLTILLMVSFRQVLPRSIYLMVFFIDILFLGGIRLGYRIMNKIKGGHSIRELFSLSKNKKSKRSLSRVLIIGAGDAGASMIKEIDANPDIGKYVVGVVDDNPVKRGTRIVGKKVLGNRDSIGEIVHKHSIDEIIIAIPSGLKKDVQAIASICGETGCKTSILPAYIDLIDGKVSISKLRRVDILDLLGREPVDLGPESYSLIGGKSVLITGAGGSIGSELCRQVAAKGPKNLVLLDIYENNLYELLIELEKLFPEIPIKPVITSIQNKDLIDKVFKTHRPQIVFHAAAHKHVPLMEHNLREALINNIIGTNNVVESSHEYSVEKFILISTDKAVNPTNIMGATKRVAEMLVQEKSRSSATIYSAVRFGNVLDSNGSVIPIFKKQIEWGGPVTVTHRKVTRFFMTIPEAVQLVIQAGSMAKGGEIFVLDMGESVKIKDLAEKLIRLSGYTPYRDIDIVYTGLRPGEKLYEELLMDEEGMQETSNGRIFIGNRTALSLALAEILKRGENALADEINRVCYQSDEKIKNWLHNIVPGYNKGVGKEKFREVDDYGDHRTERSASY